MTSDITGAATELELLLRELFLATEEGRRQVAVFAAIPDAVLDVWAGFYWDNAALYALTSPVRDVSVADLAWALDIPFWRDGDRLFAMSAREVLARPDRYPEHWDRIEAADTSYPIVLYGDGSRVIVLDGYHRLAKAALRGISTLPARIVSDEDLPGILIRDGFLGELNRLRAAKPKFTEVVRRVARELRDHQ